jgi:hypothetical protein
VREEVRARLAPFEHDGRLVMSVEMLIGKDARRGHLSDAPDRRNLRSVQVPASDLHVPVLGQLASAQLSLRDALKPGPLEVIRLDTPFGRWPLCQQTPEDALCDPYHPAVFSNLDPELHGPPVFIPACVLGKGKEHGRFRSRGLGVLYTFESANATMHAELACSWLEIGFLSSLCLAAGPMRFLRPGPSKKSRGIDHC